MLNHVKTSAKAKQLELIPQNGHLLKEVKIKARKVISGSQNLNGAG